MKRDISFTIGIIGFVIVFLASPSLHIIDEIYGLLAMPFAIFGIMIGLLQYQLSIIHDMFNKKE